MPERSLGSPLPRIFAVARATVRDLGHGARGAFGVLLVLATLSWLAPVAGGEPTQELRLGLTRSFTTFGGLAVLGTLVAAIRSIGEDRRMQRLARWSVSPLRAPEYALGKAAGVVIGSLSYLLPALLVLFLVTPGGPFRNSDIFRPQERLLPEVVLVNGKESLRSTVLLGAGDRLSLVFPTATVGSVEELVVTLDQVPWYEVSEDTHVSPRLRVVQGDDVLFDRVMQELPGTGARVRLVPESNEREPSSTQPMVVHIDAGRFFGGMALRSGELYLGAGKAPLTDAVFRAILGLSCLVTLAGCLAVGAAVFLPEVLALVFCGVLLVVSFGRALLQGVTESLVGAHDHHTAHWVLELANGSRRILDFVPDASAILGARVLGESWMPHSTADPFAAPGVLTAWLVIPLTFAAVGYLIRRRFSE